MAETSAVEQQPPFSLLIIGKKGDKQVVDSLVDSEMTVTKKQTFKLVRKTSVRKEVRTKLAFFCYPCLTCPQTDNGFLLLASLLASRSKTGVNSGVNT